jgi:hypothetical protein
MSEDIEAARTSAGGGTSGTSSHQPTGLQESTLKEHHIGDLTTQVPDYKSTARYAHMANDTLLAAVEAGAAKMTGAFLPAS